MRVLPRRTRTPLPRPHRARNFGPRRRVRGISASSRRKPAARARLSPRRSRGVHRTIRGTHEIFEQVDLAHDESIVILGDGRLGAMVAMALIGENYAPTVAGHHPEKLERLASLGIVTRIERDLTGKFDCVIDCTGQGDGFARAIELTRPRGRIVLKSTAAAGAALNLAPIVINEISVVGSRCGRFAPALAAIEAGKIDPRALIDNCYRLDEGAAAMAEAAKPFNFKILLRPS